VDIYLIRHPRPTNTADICYGRREVSVDEPSIEHAVSSVRALIPQQLLSKASIYTSPSMRCVLLARELAAPRQPERAEDLLEMDFGAWEGQSWDAIPRDELDAWARDVWAYQPGGAESATMVAQRWRKWSNEVRQAGNDAVIAVTHAGLIRVALACAGLMSEGSFAQAPVGFGSVHRLELRDVEVIK
jgi:alpha-ribazole phosphatase